MDHRSPLEALLPGVGAAVLSVLARTTQPLTIRQLADRAGASHPQVSHHVEHFERLGVVRREVVGRSHLVTLTASAASDLVRRFTFLHDEIVAHLQRTAPALQPEAVSVVAFGSFARGTAGPDSDIDVAIIVQPFAEADDGWLERLARWTDGAAAYAGSPVAEIVVSIDELAERADEPLWQSIRAEGLHLAGTPLGDLVVAPASHHSTPTAP